MDSEKIERLRERMLQCAVCMDEYRDPRILPCHHTLCYECIVNVVHSSSASGRLFKCPQCRSDIFVPSGGIHEFPINFYLTSLQDELGAKGYTAVCNTCERDWLASQFRCLDCDIDICRLCIHAHRLQTHKDIPRIIRIETANTSTQQSSNLICPEHSDEFMQMFCTKCNKAICVTCSVSNHNQHKIIPLNSKLKESKSFLQLQADNLTLEKRNAMKTAENLQTTKNETLMRYHRSRLLLYANYKKACDVIRNKKIEIEIELQHSKDRQIENIDKAINDFSSYVKEIERGLEFLLDLQDVDMCLEVLDTYKEFSYQLETFRKDVVSNYIRIEETKFSSFSFSKVCDLNLGLFRKLFYLGNLGSIYAKRFRLSVHPRTLVLKKQLVVNHLVYSWPLQYFAIFLLAFLFWQLIFTLCDSSSIFDLVVGTIYLACITIWKFLILQFSVIQNRLFESTEHNTET